MHTHKELFGSCTSIDGNGVVWIVTHTWNLPLGLVVGSLVGSRAPALVPIIPVQEGARVFASAPSAFVSQSPGPKGLAEFVIVSTYDRTEL